MQDTFEMLMGEWARPTSRPVMIVVLAVTAGVLLLARLTQS